MIKWRDNWIANSLICILFLILVVCSVLLYIGSEKNNTALLVLGTVGVVICTIALVVLGRILARKLTKALRNKELQKN